MLCSLFFPFRSISFLGWIDVPCKDICSDESPLRRWAKGVLKGNEGFEFYPWLHGLCRDESPHITVFVQILKSGGVWCYFNVSRTMMLLLFWTLIITKYHVVIILHLQFTIYYIVPQHHSILICQVVSDYNRYIL